MALELKQSLRLSQQLVMTPQLQQAIKLLQLSRLELVDLIRTEMTENPLLEEPGEGEEEGRAEGASPAEQAREEAEPQHKEAEKAQEVNGEVDDSAARDPLVRVAFESGMGVEFCERVLKRVQTFDPIGVAARDLRE